MATKGLTKKQREVLQELVADLKKKRLYHALKISEIDQEIAAQRDEEKGFYRSDIYGEEFDNINED